MGQLGKEYPLMVWKLLARLVGIFGGKHRVQGAVHHQGRNCCLDCAGLQKRGGRDRPDTTLHLHHIDIRTHRAAQYAAVGGREPRRIKIDKWRLLVTEVADARCIAKVGVKHQPHKTDDGGLQQFRLLRFQLLDDCGELFVEVLVVQGLKQYAEQSLPGQYKRVLFTGVDIPRVNGKRVFVQHFDQGFQAPLEVRVLLVAGIVFTAIVQPALIGCDDVFRKLLGVNNVREHRAVQHHCAYRFRKIPCDGQGVAACVGHAVQVQLRNP